MTPPTPSPAPTPARVSRRGVLTAALSLPALPLAGCALNDPLDRRRTPAAEAVPALAPDVGVAVEAVARIRAVEAALSATTQRHAGMAAALAGLAAMHTAHVDALEEAVPDRVDTGSSQAPTTVPDSPVEARRALVAAERRLHDELTELAMRAQSGLFARLLASMVAAISQQLVVIARKTTA